MGLVQLADIKEYCLFLEPKPQFNDDTSVAGFLSGLCFTRYGGERKYVRPSWERKRTIDSSLFVWDQFFDSLLHPKLFPAIFKTPYELHSSPQANSPNIGIEGDVWDKTRQDLREGLRPCFYMYGDTPYDSGGAVHELPPEIVAKSYVRAALLYAEALYLQTESPKYGVGARRITNVADEQMENLLTHYRMWEKIYAEDLRFRAILLQTFIELVTKPDRLKETLDKLLMVRLAEGDQTVLYAEREWKMQQQRQSALRRVERVVDTGGLL